MSLWFFFIFSILGAYGAPRPGLNVGTGTNEFLKSDVVKDGVVQPEWANNGQPHPIDSNTYEMDFYITLEGMNPPIPQPFDVVVSSADEKVWDAESFEDSTTLPLQKTIRSHVEFTCYSNSDNVLPGTPGLWNLSLAYDGEHDYDDINVHFTKVCKKPKINIGIRKDGKYEAFIANNQWVNNDWTYVAGEEEHSTTFYVWLTVDDMANDATEVKLVEQGFYANPDIMNATYIISDNAKSLEQDKDPAAITVLYRCFPDEVGATSPVELTIAFGWDFNFNLRWIKDCQNDPTEKYAPVDMGTGPFFDDIIRGGYPIGDWSKATGAELPLGVHYHTFYMSLNSKAKESSIPYQIHLYGSLPANIYDAEVIVGGQGVVEKDKDVEITIELTCRREGDPKKPEIQHMTITFPGTGYDTVVSHFYINCVQPGFNLGLKLGSSEIVSNGVLNDEWAYVAPASESKTEFWATITNSQFQIYYFHVEESRYNSKVIRPITNPIRPFAKPVADKDHDSFDVIYNCVDGVTATTPITIVLDYGWEKTLNISYVKECAPHHEPSSKGGMSPAGVFFLTIFCIGSFAYICGMLYKRFKLGHQGVECLPGIDFCRSIFNRSSTRFTPQIDYDEGAHNSSAAMSYQTDL